MKYEKILVQFIKTYSLKANLINFKLYGMGLFIPSKSKVGCLFFIYFRFTVWSLLPKEGVDDLESNKILNPKFCETEVGKPNFLPNIAIISFILKLICHQSKHLKVTI